MSTKAGPETDRLTDIGEARSKRCATAGVSQGATAGVSQGATPGVSQGASLFLVLRVPASFQRAEALGLNDFTP